MIRSKCFVLSSVSVLVLAALTAAEVHAQPQRQPSAEPVPQAASANVVRVRAEVHRVYDDRVVLSVAVDAKAEEFLAARGYRRCPAPAPELEGRIVCQGRVYQEYRVGEGSLVASALATAVGKTIIADLARTTGQATVLDFHVAR
ncbi:hypothetical protein L6R52_02300 [Myxococcota bacterium]|nr:hypothetical protein [Myxococcota bacterium]